MMNLVIDHAIKDVTPEMLDWWWDNIDSTERYQAWHPESHLDFAWESNPDQHIGKIHRVTEIIGGTPTTLRIRWEDLESWPLERIYGHANLGCVLDDNDNPISRLLHEYEAYEGGTRMRSTFLLPDGIPESFVEGLRKHNEEEMTRFSVFLPDLYRSCHAG